MLRLFQSLFGRAREEGTHSGRMPASGGGDRDDPFSAFGAMGRGSRPREDDEFNSMYS